MSKIQCPTWLREMFERNISEFEIGICVGIGIGIVSMGVGVCLIMRLIL